MHTHKRKMLLDYTNHTLEGLFAYLSGEGVCVSREQERVCLPLHDGKTHFRILKLLQPNECRTYRDAREISQAYPTVSYWRRSILADTVCHLYVS